MLCSNCGNELDGDARFCAKCGKPAAGSSQSFCTHCGAMIKEGDTFCSKCGTCLETHENSEHQSHYKIDKISYYINMFDNSTGEMSVYDDKILFHSDQFLNPFKHHLEFKLKDIADVNLKKMNGIAPGFEIKMRTGKVHHFFVALIINNHTEIIELLVERIREVLKRYNHLFAIIC